MRRPRWLAAGLCVLCVSRASAQGVGTGEPDPANVRVRIGPLYLNPSISLTNLGIDTNVFNEASDADPKRDFTLTVEPKVDLWLRVGPTWVSGQVVEQVVWYQKYATERSTSNRYQLGWRVPLNRLSFLVNGSYSNTHERPGFEIDERAQRIEKGIEGMAEVRVLANTHFGVRATRARLDFDSDEEFQGQNLRLELSRTSTTAGFVARNQLTPLTSLTLEVARIEDRFEFSTLRDSNSTAIAAGVRFDPLALIKGSAVFGFRNFEAVQPGVPDFRGFTTAVDLSYVLLGATRFSVALTRDVDYSFDVNQPYYLRTGVGATISQQVFGPVDVIGRAGAQQMAYRDRAGAFVQASDRTDRVRSYGAGIGYHLGRDLRVGFNVDRQKRTSPLSGREFEGLRFGMSMTYGSGT